MFSRVTHVEVYATFTDGHMEMFVADQPTRFDVRAGANLDMFTNRWHSPIGELWIVGRFQHKKSAPPIQAADIAEIDGEVVDEHLAIEE